MFDNAVSMHTEISPLHDSLPVYNIATLTHVSPSLVSHKTLERRLGIRFLSVYDKNASPR